MAAGDSGSVAVPRSRVLAALQALIRARVTSGLLVILPLLATYFVVRFLFTMLRDASLWVVEWFLASPWVEARLQQIGIAWTAQPVHDLSMRWQWGVAIFSVLLTVFLLYLVGLLTANFVGRRFMLFVDHTADRLPLIKTVYRASKQIVSTFSGEQRSKLQRVAVFPLQAPSVYSIGFITNTFRDARSGEEWVSILYSTTPAPTTGYLLVMRRSEVIELDWSAEETLKAILSGGLILPDTLPIPGDARIVLQRPPGASGTDV